MHVHALHIVLEVSSCKELRDNCGTDLDQAHHYELLTKSVIVTFLVPTIGL